MVLVQFRVKVTDVGRFKAAMAKYRPVIEYCGGTEIGGGFVTGTVIQPASPATFSTPALGLSLEILDEQGTLVEDPWRRTELWTADARRLSLWIHPGRIKNGVNLREELGPVLEPNKTYKLIIRAEVDLRPRGQLRYRHCTAGTQHGDETQPRLIAERCEYRRGIAQRRDPQRMAWRSRRRLVSNSAKTPGMSKKALPVAVEVSTGCSVATHS